MSVRGEACSRSPACQLMPDSRRHSRRPPAPREVPGGGGRSPRAEPLAGRGEKTGAPGGPLGEPDGPPAGDQSAMEALSAQRFRGKLDPGTGSLFFIVIFRAPGTATRSRGRRVAAC